MRELSLQEQVSIGAGLYNPNAFTTSQNTPAATQSKADLGPWEKTAAIALPAAGVLGATFAAKGTLGAAFHVFAASAFLIGTAARAVIYANTKE